MVPEALWRWAQIKGITVVGTGDFTHPAWLKELGEKAEPTGNGLLTLKKEYETDDIPASCRADIFFMFSSEISTIYKKNGRTRKVHSVIFVPDLSGALRINLALSKIGNLNADGRPILGLDVKELLRIVLDTSPGALFALAHLLDSPFFGIRRRIGL
jgi:PHP family Zn ribbon phosphoesterase